MVSRRDVSPTVGNCLDSVTDSSTGGGGEGDERGGVGVVCWDDSSDGVEVGGRDDDGGVDGRVYSHAGRDGEGDGSGTYRCGGEDGDGGNGRVYSCRGEDGELGSEKSCPVASDSTVEKGRVISHQVTRAWANEMDNQILVLVF